MVVGWIVLEAPRLVLGRGGDGGLRDGGRCGDARWWEGARFCQENKLGGLILQNEGNIKYKFFLIFYYGYI